MKAGGFSYEEASGLVGAANEKGCIPPLTEEEVEKSLNSVYNYASKNFEFVTTPWRELVGSEEPELDFLVEDLLPAACLLLLIGKPKLGKTLLALLFAVSVSLGLSLWNKKVVQGGVLFISTEDGAIRLKKRLWRMLGNPTNYNPDCHFFVGNCILTDKKVMAALRAKITELKPRLII
ncbi:MAG: AAA family ATPase, partial [Thermodesulfobacteriota bacterium]